MYTHTHRHTHTHTPGELLPRSQHRPAPGPLNLLATQPCRGSCRSCRVQLSAADPLRHLMAGTRFEDVNHCHAHVLAETLLDACGLRARLQHADPIITLPCPRDWHTYLLSRPNFAFRQLGPTSSRMASYAYQGPSLYRSLQPAPFSPSDNHAASATGASPGCRHEDWTGWDWTGHSRSWQ